MVARMPDRKYAYFRDDQIMFLVTHDAEEVSNDQLQEFRTAINIRLASLDAGKITNLPQRFSLPSIKLADWDRRVAELHGLETSLRDEERKQRINELQNLASLLESDDKRGYPTEFQNIKSLLKGEDLQKILPELQKRERSLSKAHVLPGNEAKVFERPFSPLLCHLEDTPADPRALLENIQDLRKSVRGIEFGGMTVEDVSPNWLMSVASQGGATGGPGSLPIPFIEEKEGPPLYGFDQLIEALTKAELYGKGQNVDVAILDTAPSGHELVLAAKEWPNHPLIESLLGLSGKLTLYPATYQALQRMASTSINKHDYKMTNHGLFAAGIIHSIVPEAKIHLIEVLNEFGVGDLASLVEGLETAYHKIYDPTSERRLVVNCSWMLELPLSDAHCYASVPDEGEDPEYDFEQAILRFVKEAKEQALTLRTICNNLALAGTQVVAAAGNDRKHAKVRGEKKLEKLKKGVTAENIDDWIDSLLTTMRGAPEARYPAAFVSVVGVGALPKGDKHNLPADKYEPSNYSNLGDKPAGNAIMTLGGEEGWNAQNENEGVLGLYLGDQFPRVINEEMPGAPHRREIETYEVERKNCWAWWAGTSFATPVLTGAIAAVLSGAGVQRTQEAVQALYDKCIIEQDGTSAQEDVMYVKQG